MKSLLLCSLLICFAAGAKTVGPSPTSQSAYYDSPGPPPYIPLGEGNRNLDEANTAPTPIPEDTSLILTPDNNPYRQAQEEEELFDLDQMLESQKVEGEEMNQSGP